MATPSAFLGTLPNFADVKQDSNRVSAVADLVAVGDMKTSDIVTTDVLATKIVARVSACLQKELLVDPKGAGYAGKTPEATAAMLNAPGPEQAVDWVEARVDKIPQGLLDGKLVPWDPNEPGMVKLFVRAFTTLYAGPSRWSRISSGIPFAPNAVTAAMVKEVLSYGI